MAKYYETRFADLLPSFMRSDLFDREMAAIIDEFGADMRELSRGYGTWDVLGEMDEAQLDALAAEMGIFWYDRTAGIDAKRAVIGTCRAIQHRLGTKWAVEQVIEQYFPGFTTVHEWFEYGGEPGHFKVETELKDEIDAKIDLFRAVIGHAKRHSAVLDSVDAVVTSSCEVATGAVVQDYRVIEMTARRAS